MNELKGSSNAEYHANRTHLSSSQLKLILKDPGQFHQEVVLGLKPPQEEKAAFTEGSFVHTLILEPDKVTSDYAVFPGMRRAGKEYEKFKEDNVGKTIITVPQVQRCEKLFASFKKHPMAMELIKNGQAEESYVAELQGIPCKARVDYIVSNRYIVDVKTTSMPSDVELFRQTVSQYGYDLSAALYKQIAEVSSEVKTNDFPIHSYGYRYDFYWLVLSKTDYQCHVYKASQKTMQQGQIQVAKALNLYKKCTESGIWELNQPLIVAPTAHEVEEV